MHQEKSSESKQIKEGRTIIERGGGRTRTRKKRASRDALGRRHTVGKREKKKP
jgi:hypothetical protein